MSHRKNRYGNLPVHVNGHNKGRLDRAAVADLFGFTHGEIVKAYNNWINIDRVKGSTLTFESYLNKMLTAGITPSQVGKGSNDFNLARYDDEGPYTKQSCRFITTRENTLEQPHRVVPYEAMLKKYGQERTREILAASGRNGGKANAGLPRKKKYQKTSVRIG